jgi:flagellar hook-associated protein 3 FlgL
MSNRVTQNMLNQNFLFNLNKTNQAMEKYQNQFASGKLINKPSDDPVIAVRSMYYRSNLNEISQYKKNADDGLAWMTSTDDALGEVNSVLQRVRELTVQGLNGTNDKSALDAITAEINQMKEHLGEIANTQMAGRYIFAGTDVKNPPYQKGTGEFTGNSEKLEVSLGQTNSVQINVSGQDIFNNQQIGSIFTVLSNIVNGLNGTADNSNSDDYLSQLDAQIDNVLQQRSELGARTNRMELSVSRIDDLELSTTTLLSNTEDADLSKVIIDLKAQENVQRAALAVGARIIQPSLVDFLR